MEITREYLNTICIVLTKKYGLDKKNQHIAAMFQDNDHNEIIGWAILDENNNIINRFDSLNDIRIKNEDV